MKLSKVELHEGGKEDKREFSRFKTMTEALKRGAVAAALIFSATFAVNCGPSPDPHPDGGGGDGGSMVDGGHDSGGDGGSDGGATGLCATYPHGSPNRVEMFAGTVVKPGNNTEGWLMFFKQTDGTAASIGIYPNTLSSPPVYYAFTAGQTRTIPVPGSTGDTNMQMCSVTSQPCS